MPKHLFVIIFEGRTGSSELVSRLNSHPEILCYPEILAPVTSPSRDVDERAEAVEELVDRLLAGVPVRTDLRSYNKPQPDYGVSVVGLKTRIHAPEDAHWYNRFGKQKNNYEVAADRFMDLLVASNAKLIRLRRRDLLAGAVSWLRAARLDTERNKWNLAINDPELPPMRLERDEVETTIRWLEKSQRRNDTFFEAFNGPKMAVDYEEMLDMWPATERSLLAFLDVEHRPLTGSFKKATNRDLRASVLNFDEISGLV